MDMNTLFEFLKEHWLVFLVALIVLLLIVNFVKTMIKWALVVIIIAGIAVYSGITWPDINQAVNTVKNETVQQLKDQALETMISEAKKATYEAEADGTYKITSPNLELKGSKDSSKVNVSFRGVSLGEWDMNDTIKQYIAQAKKQ